MLCNVPHTVCGVPYVDTVCGVPYVDTVCGSTTAVFQYNNSNLDPISMLLGTLS